MYSILYSFYRFCEMQLHPSGSCVFLVSPPSLFAALNPSLFQTWSALALVIVLLLLSTRDCAKSLVSRAGTVSTVHVSSRSGGWWIDGSAGLEPMWGGRRRRKEGGRGEGAGRQLAGSGCTWGAGSHRAGKNTRLQNKRMSRRNGTSLPRCDISKLTVHPAEVYVYSLHEHSDLNWHQISTFCIVL